MLGIETNSDHYAITFNDVVVATYYWGSDDRQITFREAIAFIAGWQARTNSNGGRYDQA